MIRTDCINVQIMMTQIMIALETSVAWHTQLGFGFHNCEFFNTDNNMKLTNDTINEDNHAANVSVPSCAEDDEEYDEDGAVEAVVDVA